VRLPMKPVAPRSSTLLFRVQRSVIGTLSSRRNRLNDGT